MDKVTNAIIGLGGIGMVETAPIVVQAQTADYSAVIQAAVQIIIGIFTILGLFKKARI